MISFKYSLGVVDDVIRGRIGVSSLVKELVYIYCDTGFFVPKTEP